jgi:hypothetical protein
LHYITPLQNNLLKSLLDLVVAVAWVCWQQLTEWQDERRARAAEQKPPVLRLETWRMLLAKTRSVRPVKRRRARLANASVVAVLVSEPGMAERVRGALGGGRTRLCLVSTWADLQHVVDCLAPSAIVADPAADERGDPVRHIARCSMELRIPVILYTRLTPRTAEMLLQVGQQGIQHVIFRGYHDTPVRFATALPPDRSGEPPLRAA